MNRRDQLLLGSLWNSKKEQACCSSSSVSGVIPIVSADFDSDGITYNNSTLIGKVYEVFFNDLNRFLYNEVGNQEWDYISIGGGFQVFLAGFDANSNDYHIYLLPKS